MKLIEPSVEYIPQEEGLDGIYKHIERCAKVCYKSECNITEDSAKPFVESLIKAGHTAMLEHGTLYLKEIKTKGALLNLESYYSNPYSKAHMIYDDSYPETIELNVVTNMRVLVENGWLHDLEYICNPEQYHEKRYTLKFVCDRSIAQQLTRHRTFSFAMESQRWVNYNKSGEITFIKPSWMDTDNLSEYDYECVGVMQAAEIAYLDLIKAGWKPERARKVLPNATKTELVMTGYESDWKKLFDERLRGTTGKPDEDMQYVAQLAWNEFNDKLGLEL